MGVRTDHSAKGHFMIVQIDKLLLISAMWSGLMDLGVLGVPQSSTEGYATQIEPLKTWNTPSMRWKGSEFFIGDSLKRRLPC